MAEHVQISTVLDIRKNFEALRNTIVATDLSLDATIDDCPIGRRERGKCRLQVESRQGLSHRPHDDEQAWPLVRSQEEHLLAQRRRCREGR
jgi:hypothetical protein